METIIKKFQRMRWIYGLQGAYQQNYNILRNPDFSINKRGFTEASAAGVNLVDGFSSYGGGGRITDQTYIKYESANKYLEINNDNAVNYGITQRFLRLPKGNYIVSAIVKSLGTGSYTSRFAVSGYNGSVATDVFTQDTPTPISGTDWQLHSFKFTVNDEAVNAVKLYFPVANSKVAIKSIKLEVGELSTLDNDIVLNITDETSKVEQFFKTYVAGESDLLLCSAIAESATSIRFVLPINLVATPTLGLSAQNILTAYDGTDEYTSSSITAEYDPYNREAVITATFSGLTAGKTYNVSLKAGKRINFGYTPTV